MYCMGDQLFSLLHVELKLLYPEIFIVSRFIQADLYLNTRELVWSY